MIKLNFLEAEAILESFLYINFDWREEELMKNFDIGPAEKMMSIKKEIIKSIDAYLCINKDKISLEDAFECKFSESELEIISNVLLNVGQRANLKMKFDYDFRMRLMEKIDVHAH